MKLKLIIFPGLGILFLLFGCAGAHGPGIPEEKIENSYRQARGALARAETVDAKQYAVNNYEQAKSLFQEARQSLEKLPTDKTALKFRESQILADASTIVAQETIISELSKQKPAPVEIPKKEIPTDGDWDWEILYIEEYDEDKLKQQISDTVFYRLVPHLEFSPGKAEITPWHQKILAKVAGLSDILSNHYYLAAASTDDLPPRERADFKSNRELAARRALNTLDILIWGYDLSPKNVGIISLGEYGTFRPEFEQMTREEKRRVEFWLIPLDFLKAMPEQ